MNVLKGIVTAIVSSFFIAILFAFIFRFPIPMGGYIGPLGEFSSFGFDLVHSVLVAWVFYGVMGGFIILGLCGAVSGALIGRKYAKSNSKNKMIVLGTVLISTIPVFILSILDYIIGQW